jgi:hypothetical protein
MPDRPVAQLLERVARRQRLIRWATRAYQLALPLTAVYALALLASRLLAATPDWYQPWTVVLPAVVAAVVALVWHRAPRPVEAARTVDQVTGSRDLFLTAAVLDQTAAPVPGEFAPIVQREAMAKAATLQPAAIVPFQPWQRSGHVAVALLVLLAAIAWLPQLDPFGSVEQQQIQQQRREQLAQMKKATEARAQALAQQPTDAPLSKPVDANIEQLKQAFNAMQPNDPTGNMRQLTSMQQDLGKLWRAAQEEGLKQSLSQTTQRFGGQAAQKRQEWRQQLEQGSAQALQKELTELSQLAQQMQQTSDPAQQQQMRQQLEQRLQQLADFAKSDVQAQALSQALADAMQQLNMSSMDGLQNPSLEGLEQSLQLSAAEAQSLAQTMRDMQSLQEAMKAIQAARQANGQKPLDGKACGSCNSLAEYTKLFESMCEGQGKGQGQGKGKGGLGGEGQGKGSIAPEDPTVQTDFRPEQANSPMDAGKILMQWKTRELSEKGQANIDYQNAVKAARQNVNEAITQEQVPPGYHESIQKYFDTIDRTMPPPSEEPK